VVPLASTTCAAPGTRPTRRNGGPRLAGPYSAPTPPVFLAFTGVRYRPWRREHDPGRRAGPGAGLTEKLARAGRGRRRCPPGARQLVRSKIRARKNPQDLLRVPIRANGVHVRVSAARGVLGLSPVTTLTEAKVRTVLRYLSGLSRSFLRVALGTLRTLDGARTGCP
jgi:hypothetical protein